MKKGAQTVHDVRLSSHFKRDNGTLVIVGIDQTSRCNMFELTIGYTEFMDMLSSLGERPAHMQMFNGPIGYQHEHKRVSITFLDKTLRRSAVAEKELPAHEEAIDRTLAPYEVDGWRASRGGSADFYNRHRRVWHDKQKTGTSVYEVSFHRYVHPTTGAVWGPE